MVQAQLFSESDPPLSVPAYIAPARQADPDTAHEAAKINLEIHGAQRLSVLCYLRSQGTSGATDYEIGRAIGILRTSAGKRRKELCELGLVRDLGQRRSTDTGATAMVWVVTEVEQCSNV
jgi:hypothetical protein